MTFGVGNHLLTITAARLQLKNQFIEQEKEMGTILFVQFRLVLKPNPSAFAEFLKLGSSYTARSVSVSMGPRYGFRKRRL
jgi:hypothetical protein